MIMSNFILSIYVCLLTFFMFSYYYKHLIMMIISLEFIMISIAYNMYLLVVSMLILSNLIVFMLIIVVCEGGLALSLVIILVRSQGNDYMKSLMSMKW